MGKTIGIDLGTTNSCVAVIEGKKPLVIENDEKFRTTPSIVGFTEQGERLIGHIAKRQAVTNPQNTIFSIKRLIGRKFFDPEVKKSQKIASYKIVETSNADCGIEVKGKKYPPPEISAMILQKMKQAAEDYLGEEVTEAVITVPAYFNDSQRQATKDAGRIAGLNVLRIINEPTAASLAYGLNKKKDEIIAVYDLGGGTFDLSILEIGNGVFEVKSTNGDTFLGGDDIDAKIVTYLADSFRKEHGVDLRKDEIALQRLKEAAEKAKCELSYSIKTNINLPFISTDAGNHKHLNISLTRAQLEQMAQDLIDRTIEHCKIAMKDAKLTSDDIDEVILVGGQTRMPLVQERVRKFLGKEAHKNVNPDEVVAVGAAIQGGILKGEIHDVVLVDVTPLSLGIETLGGIFTKIINKNSTIPIEESQIFTTAVDNQASVSIHVLQGERDMTINNKSLGRFDLVGIPPSPKNKPQIEVIFSIDANGIVNVSAEDIKSGMEQSIRVNPSSGLTEGEIQQMVKDAKFHVEEDRKNKKLAELRNEADSFITQTEKWLSESEKELSEPDEKTINEALSKLMNAQADDNPIVIDSAIDELSELMEQIDSYSISDK